MRNLILLLIAFIQTQLAVCQEVNEITTVLADELNGSARYNAMAGAFGALGGDLSAVSLNPAGSSVFLHSEFGGTFSYTNQTIQSSYYGSTISKEDHNSKFNQIGAIIVLNNTDTSSPWTRLSFGINGHTVARFDQQATVLGRNSKSIDSYFLYYADGLPFENLPLYENEEIKDVYRFLGEEKGYAAQQAFLGYQSYIINPFSFDDKETEYFSNLEYGQVDHKLDLLSKGVHRKTSLNFSGLYENVLHLGVNLNIHKLEYHSDQSFFESGHYSDSPVYNIGFENKLSSYVEGVSVQLGAIFRLQNLRLGLIYDSPQFLDISEETNQNISSMYVDQGVIFSEKIDPDITNQYEPYRLILPAKTTLSAAYIFGGKGLLSVDYSVQNAANTSLSRERGSGYLDNLTRSLPETFGALQTLKVGGEYRFKDISLRAGVLNRTNPQKKLDVSDQAVTFGVGFDFGTNSLSLSFVQLNKSRNYSLFSEGLNDSYTLANTFSQVSLSYNVKL